MGGDLSSTEKDGLNEGIWPRWILTPLFKRSGKNLAGNV